MKKRKLKVGKLIIAIIVLLAVIGINIFGISKLFDFSEEPKQEKEVKVVEKEQPKEKRMSLVGVGDALIHGAVYMDADNGDGTYDFRKMFTDIKPLIEKYDLKYYNQESIIGGKKIGLSHYPRLNSPEEIGDNLVEIGFNMVGLANNHSFDRDEEGLQNSVAFWKSKEGIITAGQNASFEEQNAVPIYEQNDIKFAFLVYTMCTNGLSAPAGKEYYVNVYSDEKVAQDVKLARENGAEVIIVAIHWGEEYTHEPTSVQKSTAKYLSSLGVNLVLGAHPHVIQPVDYVGDTLVVYSLGNFISGQNPLGLAKIIGLMVGMDIVVKDDKVTFENVDYKLLYTYCTSSNKNYKVIPFENLTDDILPNYKSIEQEYLDIVNGEVNYD